MQTKKLGELATFINGFAFKPTDWGDTGLPIIRIQDLTGNSYRKNYYTIFLPESTEKLIIFQTISKVFTALCALGWSMLTPSMSQRYC